MPLRYVLALYAAVCLLAALDGRLHARGAPLASRARAGLTTPPAGR